MVNRALHSPQLRGDSSTMKLLRLSLCLMLAATSAFAAETVPKPKPRPERTAEGIAVIIPIPRPKPNKLATNEAPTASAPAPAWPPSTEGWPSADVSTARAECKKLLAGFSLEYEPLEPIGRKGGCGAPAPISLTRVDGVNIKPAAVVNCDLAASLHEWVSDTVQPAARRRLKTQVTEIHAAASYVCRRRNNSSGGKLSEHGRANALDMSGFSFAKSDAAMKVGGGGWGGGILKSIGLSKDGSFLDDIRKGACKPFTTVLGPGSDRYHGDHFHVDVLHRRGDYRICK